MAPSSLNTALLYTEAATRGVLWEKVFHNISEAVIRRCSVEKVFLEISQNSQEGTFASHRPATLLKKRYFGGSLDTFSCRPSLDTSSICQ